MQRRVPNLWRKESEPARLYELYIVRLLIAHRHADIVAACRKIRSYARGAERQAALFTYTHEIDALCALGKFEAAWLQWRRRDRESGRRDKLRGRKRSAADPWSMMYDHAPLLYFRGRYEEGCRLLETALGMSIESGNVPSYDLLFHVYNGDRRPKIRPRVTLTHFYEKLEKSLTHWKHWEAFINGFSPKLFHVGRVRREELLEHPERLEDFFRRLMELRDKRTTSGVTRGQKDLIGNPNEIKKWQDDTRLRLEKLQRKQAVSQLNARLARFFPDVEV